jgi:type IX secretion system PorP/SprF family membrane protein
MRKFLLSVGAMMASVAAFGQQDYQFSQYMFDRMSINPGFTGIDQKICATSFFRSQWAGFDGAPKTFLLNLHGPVPLLRGGVGLSLFNDKIGFFNNFSARLNYSYHHALPNGDVLGIGISAGFMSVSLKPDWVAIDPVNLDGSIPDGNQSSSTYDLGFGLYYKGKGWYAGLSATHLTESDLQNLNVKNARHIYLMGGYDYTLPSNPNLTIRPSMRLESDLTSTQLDINCNVLFNQMVWGGLSYRVKDAIVPMLGFQQKLDGNPKMPGMIRIGYSYDVTTSEIKTYSSGSHEIMLSYCFNIQPPPKIQKSKTVRFL